MKTFLLNALILGVCAFLSFHFPGTLGPFFIVFALVYVYCWIFSPNSRSRRFFFKLAFFILATPTSAKLLSVYLNGKVDQSFLDILEAFQAPFAVNNTLLFTLIAFAGILAIIEQIQMYNFNKKVEQNGLQIEITDKHNTKLEWKKKNIFKSTVKDALYIEASISVDNNSDKNKSLNYSNTVITWGIFQVSRVEYIGTSINGNQSQANTVLTITGNSVSNVTTLVVLVKSIAFKCLFKLPKALQPKLFVHFSIENDLNYGVEIDA